MKKTTSFILFLALSVAFAEEEAKKGNKRGVFGEGLGLGHGSLDLHQDSHLSFGTGHSLDGHDLGGHGLEGHGLDGHNFGSEHISVGNHFGGASHHGPIDLGSSVHKHITVTKKVGIPIPQPYPVHVEKKIPVPVPHAVPYPVDKPYPVHVPKPYPVPVDKPVPYTVEKHIPYPVKVPVKVPVKIPVAVPYPAPYPVTVHKKVPVHVPEPYIVKKPVPVFIKGPDHHGIEESHGLSLDGHSSFDHGSSHIDIRHHF